MSNELAVIGPSNMSELKAFSESAAKTGFYGAKNGDQALLIAMTGRDLGLSYTAALRLIDIIDGKPAVRADGQVALVLSSGLAEFFDTTVSTATECTVETKRKGGRGVRSLTFTIAEAKQAGLTGKQNWQKYPAAMLRARAKSALARDVYPEVLAGIYDPDELGSSAPVENDPAQMQPQATVRQVVAAKSAPALATGKQGLQVEALRARLATAATPADFAALATDGAKLKDGNKDAYQAFRAEWKARRDSIATAPAPVAALPQNANPDAEDCSDSGDVLDMGAP